jgi:hypothetical protein
MPLSTCEDELLDHNTFDPNPDYWAALLWRKTMGTTILGAETPHLFLESLFPHVLAFSLCLSEPVLAA